MTDDETSEFWARSEAAGEEVRQAWLAEIGPCWRLADWDDVRILLSGRLEPDVLDQVLAAAHWHADAPRRYARKRGRKQQGRVIWQRLLAAHFREKEQTQGKMPHLAKFRSLPIYDEGQEPLVPGGGEFEIWRDRDGKVVCVHGDNRHESKSWETVKRYLRGAALPPW